MSVHEQLDYVQSREITLTLTLTLPLPLPPKKKIKYIMEDTRLGAERTKFRSSRCEGRDTRHDADASLPMTHSQLRCLWPDTGSSNLSNPTSGNSRLVPGMCDGWTSMSQRPTKLTCSADKARNDQRRGQHCPSRFCEVATITLKYVTGRALSPPPLQCDEAPWASSEEGGSFYDDGVSTSQTWVCQAIRMAGGQEVVVRVSHTRIRSTTTGRLTLPV